MNYRGFLLSISVDYRTTPTSALQVLFGLPPRPLKLQFKAGITTIARFNEPFQNSEGLLHLDVEHVQVGWVQHPSIFLHESRIALEDGGIFYPKSGIFTDGSKAASDAGAALCVSKDNPVSYQWSAKLRDPVYEAELIALLKAVEYARVNYINEDLTIFVDNKASILASINPKASNVMAKIIFANLLEAQNIYLSCIKVDSDYFGNEQADYFAKQAIEIPSNVLTLKYPISHLKRVLQKDLLTKWQKIWTDGDTGRSIYLIAPKVSFKLLHWNREEILIFLQPRSISNILSSWHPHHFAVVAKLVPHCTVLHHAYSLYHGI
ncbi:hypothetical protein AVEN_234769-1 [Araneus ventricosus]|uniref:Uncharacterized protein n=1 Tax=Araneus ventricosus TaxID=182803 RepID=A0A4Y2LZ62_ARAVE|nr:hypothetical protein AVEN_234769-1 [Araneus ventricosus]